MKEHKILLNYFQKHRDIFLENIKTTKENFDVDAIHDFRVSVKRIRAIFRFLEKINPEKYSCRKNIKELRNLFKSSGQMRDMQVQLLLLENYEKRLNISLKEFTKYLKINKKEGKKQLKKALRNFSPNILDENEILITKIQKNKGDKKLLKILQEFVKQRFVEIKSLSLKLDSVEKTHKIRIALKETSYILNIIKQYKKAEGEANFSLKEIKQLGEILGIWHDCEVMKFHLKVFAQDNLKNLFKEKPEYKKLYKTIKKDSEKLIKDLLKKIKEERKKLNWL